MGITKEGFSETSVTPDMKVLVPKHLYKEIFTEGGRPRSDIVAVAARPEAGEFVASAVTHSGSQCLAEGNEGDRIIDTSKERVVFYSVD